MLKRLDKWIIARWQRRANATAAIAGSNFTVSQIVDRALSLCVQLIKKIIMRGEIPDWSLFDITEQPGYSAHG